MKDKTLNLRGKPLNITLLSAAAWHFVNGETTAEGLAEKVGISTGRLYKWVKLPEWQKALDDLDYTKPFAFTRKPRRDIQRDAGEFVQTAETLYKQSRADGNTPKQAATFVCKALNISDRRRVNRWRERFNWEQTTQ